MSFYSCGIRLQCLVILCNIPLVGNEYVVLKTPSFAESISEGDVKWQKGSLIAMTLLKYNTHVYYNEVFVFVYRAPP